MKKATSPKMVEKEMKTSRTSRRRRRTQERKTMRAQVRFCSAPSRWWLLVSSPPELFHPDGLTHAPLPQLGAAHSSRMQGPSQYLRRGNVLQLFPLCTDKILSTLSLPDMFGIG